MKREIRVPSMGESISEVAIGRFLKSTGERVRENEEIVELETEKVNQLLYAPAGGVIHWQVEEGQTVQIDEVIGAIEEGGEAPSTAPKKEEKKPPVLKKESESAPPPSSKKTGKREKMTRLRQTIAKRLVEAMRETAMLTTFNEVDMSFVQARRERDKEAFLKEHGVKLGLMSFFVQAVVKALQAYPIFNAYIEGDEIVYRETIDIGIAVGTDKGLFVPTLRGCDRLSQGDIEKQIAQYAQKAREGGLTLSDLEGGGFTITNGGVYGSLLSTPLLNPPQVGILGMHNITKRAVVVEDKIEIRPMMFLAVSYDHRLIDGKEAISFLVKIKESLEVL